MIDEVRLLVPGHEDVFHDEAPLGLDAHPTPATRAALRTALAGLHDWGAGRCFVWVDDEVTDADRRWVADRHPAPALLHRVDPCRGPAYGDIQAIDDWLTRQRTSET